DVVDKFPSITWSRLRGYARPAGSVKRSAPASGAHQRRPGAIVGAVGAGQVVDLGLIVDDDVWAVRMPRQVILVVVLRRIKALQRLYCRGQRAGIGAGAVELRDVGFRDLALRRVDREDGRAVLRSHVGALAVALGRVVDHREVDLQQLPIADAGRIVGDAYRLGMPRTPAADPLVVGGGGAAAGVARECLADSFDVLAHRLHAPEAAARKHGR